jgi:ribosome-binding ATPase YchF (GTP1/OBG family)
MKTQDDKEKKELEVLKKCQEILEEERPIRELELDEHEELLIRGFQFLSAKPALFVLNIAEEDIDKSKELIQQYQSALGYKCGLTALSAEIEKEISELEPVDAEAFLADLHISEPATIKLIHVSYDLLGLISFFTVSEKECHAWTLRNGETAHKAAGEVHTDMQKGFIRAEVVDYETLISEGSLSACKDKGLLRLEGKKYVVKDGDVLMILFNV